MKKIRILIVLFFVFLVYKSTNANKIDSLYNVLKSQKQDTAKVNILLDISIEYLKIRELIVAEKEAKKALKISKKANYKLGESKALQTLGIISFDNSKFYEAIDYFKNSLAIKKKLNINNLDLSKIYGNIGNTYNELGNYTVSLKYLILSLKYAEKSGNNNSISIANNNIGVFYYYLENYEKALQYFDNCLKFDKKNINALSNIALIYSQLDSFYKAIELYNSLYKIYSNDKKLNYEFAGYYINKCNLYTKIYNSTTEKKYLEIPLLNGNKNQISKNSCIDSALTNIYKAIAICKLYNDINYLGISYSNLATIYYSKNDFKNSIKYNKKTYEIFNSTGQKYNSYKTAISISEAYELIKDYKNSLKWFKIYDELKDSLINDEKIEDIKNTELKYEYDKKEALNKAHQERKEALNKKEIQRHILIRNIFLTGLMVVLIFALIFLFQRNKISTARKKSDSLLLNILPYEVAEELKNKGISKTRMYNLASVMFTDFKDFTMLTEKLSPEELVAEIHYFFSNYDNILQKYNIEKIKTIGDAYLCVSGVPVYNEHHAENIIKAAIEIRDFTLNRNKENIENGKYPFELRIGIHSGPVIAGIVGIKKYAYDIWGDTVNIASRMESSGEAGKINVSEATYELLKDKFNFVHRGKIATKGKGSIYMYFVEF